VQEAATAVHRMGAERRVARLTVIQSTRDGSQCYDARARAARSSDLDTDES